MIEFINKGTDIDGTPINRENMMALQGFIGIKYVFNPEGTIVETNSKGETLTTRFNPDGTITETFTGQFTLTKTTTIKESEIEEVIS